MSLFEWFFPESHDALKIFRRVITEGKTRVLDSNPKGQLLLCDARNSPEFVMQYVWDQIIFGKMLEIVTVTNLARKRGRVGWWEFRLVFCQGKLLESDIYVCGIFARFFLRRAFHRVSDNIWQRVRCHRCKFLQGGGRQSLRIVSNDNTAE